VFASTEFILYASCLTALALFELWGRGRAHAPSAGSLWGDPPGVMRPLSAGLLAGHRQESKLFWQEQLPDPGDSTRLGSTLDSRFDSSRKLSEASDGAPPPGGAAGGGLVGAGGGAARPFPPPLAMPPPQQEAPRRELSF